MDHRQMLVATVASRTDSITCQLPASLSSPPRPQPASQVRLRKEPLALPWEETLQSHNSNFPDP